MSGPANSSPPPAKRRRMSASPPASSSAASAVVADVSDADPAKPEPDSSVSDPTISASEVIEDGQPGTMRNHPQDVQPRATWPLDAVPVEIFNLIIQYLSRRDVQAMRLVSREFDSKLADSFFRVVVVPFRPEFEALYGTLNTDLGVALDTQKYGLVLKKRADESAAADDGDDIQARASPIAKDEDSLLSDGYRVFDQFGPTHIKKFALALELNEADLACPPVKLNQEIVPAPWGLYRWPISDYQRYAQLEGIEKLADETQHMKKAFQLLRVVSEIGISCDAGLGYLQGPDTNPLYRRVLPPVFRPAIYGGAEPDSDPSSDEDNDRSMSLVILKQMAMNAGYDSNEWPRAVLRLLEDEGRAVKWVEQISTSGASRHEKVPLFEITKDTTKEDIILLIEKLVGDDDQENVISAAHARVFGLTPNNLTASQVEMLLELEWAHRALMDSYVIAVMDNKDSFHALRTLTIARCSGRHVPSLMKSEFWEAMTCLNSFQLGVIPDWRRLHKDDTGGITQSRISPVETYEAVFKLLHNFVGEQKNMKHVSFEWICGGEFAVGKSQRDRYIMPAPVLAEASKMVDLQHNFGEEDLINLPDVEKLSLKNCWFTPHVFLNIAKKMSKEMLKDLELESVSLTGPPSKSAEPSIHPGPQGKPSHWPWPLCAGAEPGSWFQLQRPAGANNNNNNNVMHMPPFHGGHAVAAPFAATGPVAPAAGAQHAPVAVPQNFHGPNGWAQNTHFLLANPGAGAVAVNQPVAPVQQSGHDPANSRWRLFSWPHILASLDMSSEAVQAHLEGIDPDDHHYRNVKTAEQRFSAKFKNVLDNRGGQDKLKTITFKSCGYALIESSHISNWKIIPNEPLVVQHDIELPNQLKDLDTQMLISNDGLLGKVLNYIPESERQILSSIFGLGFGWEDIYDDIVKQIAIADGNPDPGSGRFHGTVCSSAETEVNDPNGQDDKHGEGDNAGDGFNTPGPYDGVDEDDDAYLNLSEDDQPPPPFVSRFRAPRAVARNGLTAETLRALNESQYAAEPVATTSSNPTQQNGEQLVLALRGDIAQSNDQQGASSQDGVFPSGEQLVVAARGGPNQSSERQDVGPQSNLAQSSEQQDVVSQDDLVQSSEQQVVASQDGLGHRSPASDTASDAGEDGSPLINSQPHTGT
ncbi:hypothetical protein N8I77_009282 [Diaporthe amygdali]|uniref:F-box domain-containing protein n=1 Tax=Phomopsis amygdali TaxID=1214568 RepID=A0AAD9SAQ4_PHOAM|nr:hypothetical protein N8I77_009282 [Diaporthe amygdali]